MKKNPRLDITQEEWNAISKKITGYRYYCKKVYGAHYSTRWEPIKKLILI